MCVFWNAAENAVIWNAHVTSLMRNFFFWHHCEVSQNFLEAVDLFLSVTIMHLPCLYPFFPLVARELRITFSYLK